VSRQVALATISAVIVLSACAPSAKNDMLCEGGEDTLILAAQAVQSATMIPCVTTLAEGWSIGGFSARTGSVRFWMDSDRAGSHAVEVELAEACDTSKATELEPGPAEAERFEQRTRSEPELGGRRFWRFPGGCVTLRYDFERGAGADLLAAAESSVTLIPRDALVAALEERRGLILCGVGHPECLSES
jgi:hypothetical protein